MQVDSADSIVQYVTMDGTFTTPLRVLIYPKPSFKGLALSPKSGPSLGGFNVTIHGTGFNVLPDTNNPSNGFVGRCRFGMTTVPFVSVTFGEALPAAPPLVLRLTLKLCGR